MEEDKDDPIVKEIDVILCQELKDSLCLIQYPLRPPWRPPYNENLAVKAARVKPRANRLQMSFYEPHQMIQTTAFQGDANVLNARGIPLKTNYAVGLHRDNAIYLTPVSTVYQMRPDFTYIDDKDAVLRKKRAAKAAKEEAKSGTTSKKKQAKTLTLHSRAETKEQARRRKQSWAYLKKREDDEEWVKLEWKATTASYGVMDSLTPSTNVSDLPMNIDKEIYMDHINPPQDSEDDNWGLSLPTGSDGSTLSIAKIRQLSEEKGVEAVMNGGRIMKMGEILGLCGEGKIGKVIKTLQEKALLVRGVWIVKSVPLLSTHITRKSNIRDYILSLFATTHEYLDIDDVALTTKASPSLIKSLISKICKKDKRGFTLIKGPDHGFMAKYKDLNATYARFWPSRQTELMSYFLTQKEEDIVEDEDEEDDNSMSREVVRTEVTEFVITALRKYGVCSISLLTSEYNKEKGSTISASAIKKELSKVAGCIEQAYYLKELNDSDDPKQKAIEKYRAIIINCFKTASKEGKISITRATVRGACQKKLGKDIPTKTYSSIMRKLAYTAKGAPREWIFKSGNGRDNK